MSAFSERYGRWAIVAGASEGIGEAFAFALAVRGLDIVAIARRPAPLAATAERLRALGSEVVELALDLGDPDASRRIVEAVGEREVGLVVYNAAFSRVGEFLDQPVADHLRTLDVDCRTPLTLVHHFAAAMKARRRGGIVLMGSMSGLQGAPRLASYAASKAFTQILGESLWGELRPQGIDVLTCIAGSTRTPGFLAVAGKTPGPVMEAAEVVEEALAGLGKVPSLIPGTRNRLATWVLDRLGRARRIGLVAKAISSAGGSREDPGS